MRGTGSTPIEPDLLLRFIPARAGNSWPCGAQPGAVTVHPRACGEQPLRVHVRPIRAGSSPRVRGTASNAPARLPSSWFIPARAGNRPLNLVVPACPGGSSPRVRGTVFQAESYLMDDRFIPARAGNSPAPRVETPRAPVHPRACGEQTRTCGRGSATPGSSPRVRGTAAGGMDRPGLCRFIPARAGNSSTMTTEAGSSSVHPRACGEQALSKSTTRCRYGSSPRVRGNRARGRRHFRRRPVHPRACGEQDMLLTKISRGFGSSPRVRGTARVESLPETCRRFIPARAGNRVGVSSTVCPTTVHPRACGEQAKCSPNSRTSVGSSPRVRGTAHPEFRRAAQYRFIPARAGNS